jgi:hypothetical protein
MTEQTRTHAEQQKRNAGERRRAGLGQEVVSSCKVGLVSPEVDILALQRAAGNQSVGQLLQPSPGSSSDIGGAVVPLVYRALRSTGRPLDADMRAFMESHLNHDFSRVRVHTDARAAESARVLNAQAYTIGRYIVFGTGQYAPESMEGRRLLGHELAHVVQQSRGGPVPVLHPSAPHEQDAARVASSVITGQTSVSVQGATGVGLARDNGKPVPPAHAGGEMGERDAAFVLGKMGLEIVIGPGGEKGHKLTTSGFDIVADDPRTGELLIVDNKAVGGVRKIQDASALTTNLVTNLKRTINQVQKIQDFPRKTDVLKNLNAALNAVSGGKPLPKNVRLVVTNAAGFATGVGSKLTKQGVEFIDLVGKETIKARKMDIARAKAAGKRPGRSLQTRTTKSRQPVPPKKEVQRVRPTGPIGRVQRARPIKPTGLGGAVGGAVFQIHGTQVAMLEQAIYQRADEEIAKRWSYIEDLRFIKEEVVVIRIVVDEPYAVDILGRSLGIMEPGQQRYFEKIEILHGPSEEEALAPPPHPTISQGPRKGRAFRKYVYRVYYPFSGLTGVEEHGVGTEK